MGQPFYFLNFKKLSQIEAFEYETYTTYHSILISFSIAKAQKPDLVTQSFVYKVSYTIRNEKVIDDLCQLDISNQQSFFYSLTKVEEDKRLEERIKSSLSTNSPMNIKLGDLKQDRCNFTIIKDYKAKKAFYAQEVGRQNFAFIRDSLSAKRWKLLDERKVINNLSCRKAQMKRDTTLITAWFCPDVPTAEGPLYYYGLPGIIVQVTNSAGWECSLVKMNKVQRRTLQIPEYSIVTEAQLRRAIVNLKSKASAGSITLPSGATATIKTSN